MDRLAEIKAQAAQYVPAWLPEDAIVWLIAEVERLRHCAEIDGLVIQKIRSEIDEWIAWGECQDGHV